ncbi:hypothetical protein LK09_17625 [Microbacterium mangrovi]|uniref:thymidylate synthase n=1 Tax=Microbacterium mangrovi TaxID=1348253 RepID=A0A0B2A244_9MICO|nr:thymidylate synthase [Microbacterium mangrovi]KHK95849.1 hypothetical protein LK09_17625 [Microbacterium mangrovi]
MLLVEEDSVDDVLQVVLNHLLRAGSRIEPSKGPASEQVGAAIELRNPRARLSRSHRRSPIFSALGEWLWYLSGTDEVGPIAHYIPMYLKFAVEGRVEGAYGPRLFGADDRLAEVIKRLRDKQDSRQAVIQVFAQSDLSNQRDIPCTTTLQFLLRDGLLHLAATMRSNDAYRGLPHDIFAFTMIQEMVARNVGVEVGTYLHFVGSLHLYDSDADAAAAFLDEGWHNLKPMPAMPDGDPAGGVRWIIEVEERIRLGDPSAPTLADLGEHPYWDDLARVLLAFPEKSGSGLRRIRESFDDPFYEIYINDRHARFEED